MSTPFERIEQQFGDTTEKLGGFIYAYIMRHYEPFQITPSFDDRRPGVYFVARPICRRGQHSAGKVRVIDAKGRITSVRMNAGEHEEFLPNPDHEGTILIKPYTIPVGKISVDLNCSIFTCEPRTDACRRFALGLREDIRRKGYDLPGHRAELSKPQIGRPPLPDDEWAWARVNIFGDARQDVNQKWLARIEDDPERCKMKDPQKHFDRFIRRGRD